MSNSLDPDQACHFVGPDLGTNCLQRLSEETLKADNVLNFCNHRKDPQNKRIKMVAMYYGA